MIGSNEGNIRGYIKGVIPKQDVLERIVRNIEVNPEWLLTGEGNMIRQSEGVAATVQECSSNCSSGVQKEEESCSNTVQSPPDTIVLQLLEKISSQAKEIGRLERLVEEANERAEEAEQRAAESAARARNEATAGVA
jgi:hypothetical protein